MIIDANLLVYAFIAQTPQHEAARAWLEQQLSASRVGLPWASLNALVRVATHPRLFARPLRVQAAWALVEELLARPNVWVPAPVPGHATIVGRLLGHAGVGGNLVYDAHLGAIAVGHGLTVFTNDSDFGRFREVVWANPLHAGGCPA